VSGQRVPGDHSSGVSAGYAAFRPQYPRALFEFLAAIAPRRGRVWDCGTGTGQAAVELAAWFDDVIATDVSAAQIAQAPSNPKIEWIVTPAETTPLQSASIDLVTVAQALHWFDHARFYDEVRRRSAAMWTKAIERFHFHFRELPLPPSSSSSIGPARSSPGTCEPGPRRRATSPNGPPTRSNSSSASSKRELEARARSAVARLVGEAAGRMAADRRRGSRHPSLVALMHER
jgi:hypothetical protein